MVGVVGDWQLAIGKASDEQTPGDWIRNGSDAGNGESSEKEEMRIKVNDTVEIIAGNDKGSQGKVLTVNKKTGKVVVEGVNLVYKHVRRSQKNPQGGRLSKEMPIQAANVMVVCESCNQPSRTGYRYTKDGSKERFCKKCGSSQGEVSPPKAAYAAD